MSKVRTLVAPKQMLFEQEARARILHGIDCLANLCVRSYGPKGGAVIMLSPGGNTMASRSGRVISKSMELQDPFSNMGVRALQQAACQVHDQTGDGTTTTILLARRLIHEVFLALSADADANALRAGLHKGTVVAIENLAAQAQTASVDDLREIMASAVSDDGLIDPLLEVVATLGPGALVQMELGPHGHDKLRISEGAELPFGHQACEFPLSDPTATIKLTAPLLSFHRQELRDFEQIAPLLELARRKNRPILFLVNELTGAALEGLAINNARGTVSCLAVRVPPSDSWLEDRLQDLEVLCGGRADRHPDDSTTQLGSAKEVWISPESTTFVEPNSDVARLREHIDWLQAQREMGDTETRSPTGQGAFRDRCDERLATLAGRRATIEVGAPTDLEAQHRLSCMQSAYAALDSAQEGVVAGGGQAFLTARLALAKLDEPDPGVKQGIVAIERCLAEPARLLGQSSTGAPKDSFKTLRLALQVAVGVAGIVANTGALMAKSRLHGGGFSAKAASQSREQFWQRDQAPGEHA